MEINPYLNQLKDLNERGQTLRGIFDYDLKKERLEEVLRELEDPAIWNDQSRAQAMAKEKGELENVIHVLRRFGNPVRRCPSHAWT